MLLKTKMTTNRPAYNHRLRPPQRRSGGLFQMLSSRALCSWLCSYKTSESGKLATLNGLGHSFEGSTNATQLSGMLGLAFSPVLTNDTILVDVQLFGYPFSFFIDTGAAASLIHLNTWKCCASSDILLQPSPR